VDPEGKRLEDRIDAPGYDEAMRDLKEKGLRVISLRHEEVRERRRIGHEDFAVFNRQLAGLLKSEIPMSRALRVLARDMKKRRFRKALEDVGREVEAGTPLPEAFGKRADCFPSLYVGMVDAGIRSGNLPGVLEDMAAHAALMGSLRRKVREALTYPFIVLVFIIVIGAVLLLLVAPRYLHLFHAVLGAGGIELSALDTLLLRILEFATENIHYLAPGLLVLLFILYLCTRILRRIKAGSRFLGRLVLACPGISRIAKTRAISQFYGTLGLLLKGGVPMVQAIDLLQGATPNRHLASQLDSLRIQIREGADLSEGLNSVGIFPATAVWLTSVGEDRGDLPDMLLEIAQIYKERLARTLETVRVLVEPAAELLLAVVVLFFLLTFLSPLFGLAGRLFRWVSVLS
jgi:type IV pilus assembly protein PilC